MRSNSAKIEKIFNSEKPSKTIFPPISNSSIKSLRQSEVKNDDQDEINRDYYKPLMKFKCINDISLNSVPDTLFEEDSKYENKNRRFSNDSSTYSDYYPKKSIKREKLPENIDSRVFQLNTSPYFWFFKEKSKFSPYKPIKRPSLDTFKLMQSQSPSHTLNKSIIQKETDSKSSIKNDVYNNYKNYKKKKPDKKCKTVPKSYEEYKKYINYKLAQNHKQNYITSARLRELAVSEKFIPEAKRTIYIPHSHSLLPRSIGRKSIISFL